MNNISTQIYAANVAELENEALYSAAYRNVTEERRKKTDSFRMQRDRRLSLGVELLLMRGLEHLGLHLNEMSYQYGINGKPYLTGEKEVYFNLSHSEEVAVCAVSSQEIGCDVEKISDINLAVAKRFFSADEYHMIESQHTVEDKRELFFRLWTLKESFIKLTGKGMYLPMDSFCISLGDAGISIKQEYNEKSYYFQEMEIWENYKCSVCGLDSEIGSEKGVPFEIVSLSEFDFS